jgi:adenylate cyclase class 2
MLARLLLWQYPSWLTLPPPGPRSIRSGFDRLVATASVSVARLYFRVPHRSRTRREIEVKLPVADLVALFRNLDTLGAIPGGRVLEQNTVYDTPSGDFRRQGLLLRLRIETPAPSGSSPGGRRRVILTSKAPPPDRPAERRRRSRKPRYKERLERELLVTTVRRWPVVLGSLGLHPSFRYEKYRTTFRLPGLHLDLDETPIGIFLELEGTPRIINRVSRALGFSPEDCMRVTYWDLYAAACRRRGRVPGNMMFDT